MTKKIRILRTAVTNPWFNLATENWILRDLDPDTSTLYLWRNDNTVVIGRYQNPWVECKVDKMNADNIYLARRQSGGGAVFMIWEIPTLPFYHHEKVMLKMLTLRF